MARLLHKGTTGDDVRVLQDRLNYHLRRETPLKVDGDFGTNTHNRVVKFQTLHGIKIDGKVGEQTRAILFETDEVPLQILVSPKLTLPTFRSPAQRFGIKPPNLIPPLTFPPTPNQKPAPFVLQPPIILGPSLTLGPVASSRFAAIQQPSLLNLTYKLVPVQDPSDPVVRSTQNLIRYVEQFPQKDISAFIVSKIPKPNKSIEIPTAGFNFKPKIPGYNPLNPDGVTFAASAAYTIKIFQDPSAAVPIIMLQGKGQGEINVKYTGEAQSNYFSSETKFNFLLSFLGVF